MSTPVSPVGWFTKFREDVALEQKIDDEWADELRKLDILYRTLKAMPYTQRHRALGYVEERLKAEEDTTQ